MIIMSLEDPTRDFRPLKKPGSGFTLLVVLTLLRVSMVLPSAQAAVSFCAPSQPNPLFDGVQNNPGSGNYSIRGAKASIDIRTADLCTSEGPTFSGAWSMVAATNVKGWAQIGYLVRSTASEPTPTAVYFWQWMRNSTVPDPMFATHIWGSPPLDQAKLFTVEYKTSDNALHLYVAGSQAPCNGSGKCAETPFDPLVAWDGTQGQWYGETGFAGSDVPGRASSKTEFSGVRVKLGSNWQFEPWTSTGSDKCFYKLSLVDPGQRFQIWTQPIDHSC